MAKEVINATVNHPAKTNIKAAMKPVLGENGSISGMLEEFGEKLQTALEGVTDKNGKVPPCSMEVRLIPKG